MRWIAPTQEPVSPELLAAVGGHPLVARLLARRGMAESAAAMAFLDPRHYVSSDPYDLPGMADLVRQLQDACDADKRIRIWGDLDADGQTSTAVLYETLSALDANVDYRIPRHSQGHGLPMDAIEEALRDGVEVLVTCDTGVTDVEPIREAVERGMTVLITDHHDPPATLPPAAAIVDSKMVSADHPMATLAGVGVAYQVARALLGDDHDALEPMLDLVALGLVVDMVEQRGDVRYLIQLGIERLRHSPRAGLAALGKLTRVDMRHLTERHLQFQIGPRVNAAGRLGDANVFCELLMTRDHERALVLAGQLEALNQDRRARTEALREQLLQMLERDPDALRQPALILQGEGWPEGVSGSAAGELARVHGKPVILIMHHEGGLSTASARSVPGVNIHSAIASQAERLERQGGHPMAAGFAAKRDVVDLAVRGIQSHLAAAAAPEAERVIELDAELDWSSISMAMAEQISRLRPFGVGNQQPVLLLRRARLERTEPLGGLGAASPHRRLHFSDGGDMHLPMIWFRAGELPLPGDWINVAFRLGVGYWRGEQRLDVQLVDWRPAADTVTQSVATSDAFEINDQRDCQDAETLIAELRSLYGQELWLWAEGQVRPEGAQSRIERGDQPCVALALANPAASPAILRDVLDQAQPQRVILLPATAKATPSLQSTLALAAGLARSAVERHGGALDYARAEQAVGLPEPLLRAAMRVLVARGVYLEIGGRLAAGTSADAVSSVDNPRLVARMRQQLGEVGAYRRAFGTMPAAVLLARD